MFVLVEQVATVGGFTGGGLQLVDQFVLTPRWNASAVPFAECL